LAALETSTACLVLTGNLRPSPLVVKQADEFGVAVLQVRTNTLYRNYLDIVYSAQPELARQVGF
jgi:BioD-like phosphotransacetylase family protein